MNVLLPDNLDDRLERVCRHIMQKPADKLSLNRLAQIAFLSPFHFLRLFKKSLHETPHHFVTRMRIEKAKDLLAGVSHSITEISLIVGFESMGSFSRTFHAATGWSPSIYRSRSWAIDRQPSRFIPACYRQKFGLDASLGIGLGANPH